MHVDRLHFEDVKAALRKRFSTVTNFEEHESLPKGSVHDHYRGRRSARVRAAIEKALATPLPAEFSEYSNTRAGSHRQNGGAK